MKRVWTSCEENHSREDKRAEQKLKYKTQGIEKSLVNMWIGNHICSIDLTSHNISFTTLNIVTKDDCPYLFYRAVFVKYDRVPPVNHCDILYMTALAYSNATIML